MLFVKDSKIVAGGLATIAISGAGIGIGMVFGWVLFFITQNPKTLVKFFLYKIFSLISQIMYIWESYYFIYSISSEIVNMQVNRLSKIIQIYLNNSKNAKKNVNFLLSFFKSIQQILRLHIFFDSSIIFIMVDRIHNWLIESYNINVSNSIIVIIWVCIISILIILFFKKFSKQLYTYICRLHHRLLAAKINIMSQIVNKFVRFKVNYINLLVCTFVDWVYFKPLQFFSYKLYNIKYIIVDSVQWTNSSHTDLGRIIIGLDPVSAEYLENIYINRIGKYRYHLLFWLITPVLTICQVFIFIFVISVIISGICIKSLHPQPASIGSRSFKQELSFVYYLFRGHRQKPEFEFISIINSIIKWITIRAIWLILGISFIFLIARIINLTFYLGQFNCFSNLTKAFFIIVPLRHVTILVGIGLFYSIPYLYSFKYVQQCKWSYFISKVVLSITSIFYSRLYNRDMKLETLLVYFLSWDFPSGLVDNRFIQVTKGDGSSTWRLNYPFHRKVTSTLSYQRKSKKFSTGSKRTMFTRPKSGCYQQVSSLSVRTFSAKVFIPSLKWVTDNVCYVPISKKIENHGAVKVEWQSPEGKTEIGFMTLTSAKPDDLLDVHSTGVVVDDKNNLILIPTKPTKIHTNILFIKSASTPDFVVPDFNNITQREFQLVRMLNINPQALTNILHCTNAAIFKLADCKKLLDAKGRSISREQFELPDENGIVE